MRFAAYCLMLVLAGHSPLRAEHAGKVSGVVADQSEAVVPNAHVVLMRDGTDQRADVFTDGVGRFDFINLVSGTYHLIASSAGFENGYVPKLQVSDGVETDVGPITLKIKAPFPDGCGNFLQPPDVMFQPLHARNPEISGSVADPSNVGLSGVRVILSTVGGGQVAFSRTDGHGDFALRDIQPGKYTLLTRLTGYTIFMIDVIEAKPGSASRIVQPLRLQRCPRKAGCAPIKKISVPGICL
jgi:hypothetical protein